MAENRGDAKTERPLQRMFSSVPRRYDLINRIFTLRFDEAWRGKAVEECLKGGPGRVLDLCTGTGDLALRLARASGPGSSVIGADFSMPMLEQARLKAARSGANVSFVLGDVSELPFMDRSFGVIGIAFAFRNLTYRNKKRDKYLSEIIRVLSAGGRLVIVESSQPRRRIARVLMRLYLKISVSFLGGLISGQRAAYRYLAHSAANFYTPEELSGLLLKAGFGRVEYRALFAGFAAIHVAYK